MARVLLINSNRFRHPWPVIPVGLCYIATVLETNGSHTVSFLDLCFSLNCEADIKKRVRDFVPDVIGISIRNIDDTGGYDIHFLLEDVKNDVVDFCKNEFSGPIVIGGPAVGISGGEMLEYFDLEEIIKNDSQWTGDNFLLLVKIELVKICLEDIHSIAKRFAFRFPNFYFYEKEHIIPGWILMTGNLLLNVIHSRQPVWRLLIFLKRVEQVMGISLAKRVLYEIKMNSYFKKRRKANEFSLIIN